MFSYLKPQRWRKKDAAIFLNVVSELSCSRLTALLAAEQSMLAPPAAGKDHMDPLRSCGFHGAISSLYKRGKTYLPGNFSAMCRL